ncbi:dihydrodipicolinate synthase family protein [Bremerella alba]|uniref:N-acetylneuraminate lyase n=1 Tax=Bremerella alba TaxID=980252 RepID=A0A7V8V2N8_9BACT|nr:dihydrodipicolinate synthase family protein [Bremerella alba]MBA2113817.1 N-acetylneuraminate lyase [Bremerella alba]
MATRLISAICTPLDSHGNLHADGLSAHLEAQLDAGIDGILAAGTMGLMQLQTDQAHQQLVEVSAACVASRCELWVGVGDTSYQRTLARIRIAERYAVDGLVVLTPYLMKFSQAELRSYYWQLADVAQRPLFLYDLPGLTGTELSLELIEQVIQHPNIHGLKCTRTWQWTVDLWNRIGDRTRIVPAQPERVADLIRLGVPDNLDGLFPLFPHQARALAEAADRGDFAEAKRLQEELSAFLPVAREAGLFGSVTAVLNAMGIPVEMAPEPSQRLDEKQRARLLAQAPIQRLIENETKRPVFHSSS